MIAKELGNKIQNFFQNLFGNSEAPITQTTTSYPTEVKSENTKVEDGKLIINPLHDLSQLDNEEGRITARIKNTKFDILKLEKDFPWDFKN